MSDRLAAQICPCGNPRKLKVLKKISQAQYKEMRRKHAAGDNTLWSK
jgi:hypothetical protein